MLLLELADLLGHVGVAEEEGGVGEVDHELGGVLRLREHGLQISGSVVHWRVSALSDTTLERQVDPDGR